MACHSVLQELEDQFRHLQNYMPAADRAAISKVGEVLDFYRQIYENPRLGYFRIDRHQKRVTECNDGFARLCGHAGREQLLESKAPELPFVRPADRAELLVELERSGNLSGRELELVQADKPRWVLFSAWLHRGNNYIEGLVADVTAFKRTEAALKISEAKYSRLFKESPDLVMLSDFETGEIFECNDSVERLTGWDRQQALGNTTLGLGVWSDAAERCRLLDIVSGKDEPVSYETTVATRDGRLVPVMLAVSMIDIDGRQCLYTAARDLTEHHRLEQESLRSEKLEAAITLAGGIAHDFNNLLSSIMGNIEMLKYSWGRDEDRCLQLIDNARLECERARQLTHKFLTISRGTSPNRRSGSLSDLVRSAAEEALRGQPFRCDFELDDDLFPVRYDEGQIRHVIVNLMLNAAQAMPDGGTVNVVAENAVIDSGSGFREIRPGDYVRIKVLDEGCGIAAEHLPRIFDPYFSTKPLGRQKGLGLGLTIVHSIVSKHEGYIFVESIQEQGTCVTVYLPVCADLEACG